MKHLFKRDLKLQKYIFREVHKLTGVFCEVEECFTGDVAGVKTFSGDAIGAGFSGLGVASLLQARLLDVRRGTCVVCARTGVSGRHEIGATGFPRFLLAEVFGRTETSTSAMAGVVADRGNA